MAEGSNWGPFGVGWRGLGIGLCIGGDLDLVGFHDQRMNDEALGSVADEVKRVAGYERESGTFAAVPIR